MFGERQLSNQPNNVTTQDLDDELSIAMSQQEESTVPAPRWQNLEERGWRRLVQNLTPSWFSINMGTGIVSILLRTLPFPGSSKVLHPLSTAIFILNFILFCFILSLSILRYILYPRTWGLMIRHPVQSLFLGTLPMGFATIITMGALVCVPKWGGPWPKVLWVLWWCDAVVSLAVCIGLPFIMINIHKTSLNTMTAVWLLPVVAPIVAAATGSTIASILPESRDALYTIVTGYVLWGVGFPMAMIVLVIYFHRLAMHRLPPVEMIVSCFLPLGPLGQGGYAIMQLGKLSMKIFPKTGTLNLGANKTISDALDSEAGKILYVIGFFIAIISWGFGLCWLCFALASISRSKFPFIMKFPFNMSWWAFTFPIGVFAMSTLTIGAELPSPFFSFLGTAIAICVMLLWLLVIIKTTWAARSGKLFFAPCLHGDHNTCPKEAANGSDVTAANTAPLFTGEDLSAGSNIHHE